MEIIPLDLYPTPPVEPNVAAEPVEETPPPQENPPEPPPVSIEEEHQIDEYA